MLAAAAALLPDNGNGRYETIPPESYPLHAQHGHVVHLIEAMPGSTQVARQEDNPLLPEANYTTSDDQPGTKALQSLTPFHAADPAFDDFPFMGPHFGWPQVRTATTPSRDHIIPTRLFQFSFEAALTSELIIEIERGVGMMIGECGPVGRAYVGLGLHPNKIITILERVTETGWRLWGGIVKPLEDTDWDTVATLHARVCATVARASNEWTETDLYARQAGQARDLDTPTS